MPETKRFNTGEVDLAYSELPGKSPPLVVFHGLSGSHADLLERVHEGRHAYGYDARGHNDSGRASSYTFVDYGNDAVAFMKGIVREPALVLGHSLGAMTCVYLAANCPELVLRAFLVDSPIYAPEVGLKTGLRDEKEMFIGVRDAAGKPVEALVAQGVPPMRAESMSKLDPATMQAVIDASAFPGWDTDDLLRRIECPVWFEHGDRALGSAIYAGELERATSLLKHCTVVHIEGTGHVPWFVDQQRFLIEVTKFLDAD